MSGGMLETLSMELAVCGVWSRVSTCFGQNVRKVNMRTIWSSRGPLEQRYAEQRMSQKTIQIYEMCVSFSN